MGRDSANPQLPAILAALIIWTVIFGTVSQSSLGDYLLSRVESTAQFWVRHQVWKKIPPQSERLMTFALDDKTVASLPYPYPTGDQWGTILKRIGRHKPRAVIIDAVFSKLDDPAGGLGQALQELKAEGVEVVLGSFLARREILGRPAFPKSTAAFAVENVFHFSQASTRIPQFYDGRNFVVYGPRREIVEAGAKVGHLTNTGTANIIPFVTLGDGYILPDISMHAAEKLELQKGRVLADGKLLPIANDGKMLVDFAPSHVYAGRTFSLLPLLKEQAGNLPITGLAEGDVVLILIHMFTGHTDVKWTPVGSMPGGRFLQASINAVLTGATVQRAPLQTWLIGFMVLLGALLGARLGVVTFWLGAVAAAGLYLWAASALFVLQGVLVPWLFPVAGFAAGGLSLYTLKTRGQMLRARRLHAALDGALEPQRIEQLIQVEDQITFDARERVVTILFIDVVGFSRMAENMLPRVAFTELKDLLGSIADVIHEYGGVIDKTLGDGLLCYFGYQFDRDETSPNHAETALRCAIAIQESNLKRNQKATQVGKNVYPLRIGINTASSFLGDLGSGMRVDFTVVGNGVNFAKRLEGAAEMYAILMGQTTYDFVRGLDLPLAAISKKFIKIKHHNELIEAYEYDPLFERKQVREEAVEAFRKCANIERVDRRWSVPDPAKIAVHTDFGIGHLVNFASKGFSVKIPKLLSKGTHLTFTLDSAGGVLQQVLEKQGIQVIQGEVRWSYGDDRGYIHGVMFKNLSPAHSQKLIDTLCEFAFTGDNPATGADRDDKAS